MRAVMEIRGTLVGHIWMPNAPAWKYVKENLSRTDRPFTLHVEPGTSTRDALLRVMMAHDGDFQSCAFLDATLILSRTTGRGGRTVRRSRALDLRQGENVQDLFTPEEEREDWEFRIMDACSEEEEEE